MHTHALFIPNDDIYYLDKEMQKNIGDHRSPHNLDIPLVIGMHGILGLARQNDPGPKTQLACGSTFDYQMLRLWFAPRIEVNDVQLKWNCD